MTTRTDVEFTFDEAVRTMGVTPERLEKMIAEGKVATVRVSGRTLIPRSAILEYFGGVSALLPRDKKKIAAAAAKTEAPAKTAEPAPAEEPAKTEA
jgi:excisionase family DNA binding protein